MSSRRERIRSDRSQISEISSTRSPKVRPFEHDDEVSSKATKPTSKFLYLSLPTPSESPDQMRRNCPIIWKRRTRHRMRSRVGPKSWRKICTRNMTWTGSSQCWVWFLVTKLISIIISVSGSAIEKVSNAEKKKGKPVSQDDRGQKITASGGSAINTAVFVQNANQLRKLLTPQYCSIPYMAYTADINSGNMTRVEPWIDGTKTVPNTCDAFRYCFN